MNKNTNLTINLFPRPFPNAVRISSKLSRIEQTTIKKKKEEKKKTNRTTTTSPCPSSKTNSPVLSLFPASQESAKTEKTPDKFFQRLGF